VLINLNGTTLTHFWVALVFAGIELVFLFVGSTTLLTQTYVLSECFKVQAVNDFIIFTTVAVASLSTGYLQHHFCWQAVNVGVLPFLAFIMLSIIFLFQIQQKLFNAAVVEKY